MGYLPIFLNAAGLKCMVVGGGQSAEHKTEALLLAKAAVIVVSPRLTPALAAMASRGEITHLNREYRRGDMKGCALVYAATGDDAVHRAIAAEARELGIPLNVADDPELCSFIAPAVVRQGALQIAISTGGASPAFASRVRRELEPQFGPELGPMLDILRAARGRLRALIADSSERARRLTALANSDLPVALRAGDSTVVERLLHEHLGDGFGLGELGIGPSLIGPAHRHRVPD
ncbi:MAG: precorrin-2 dehydrogenase/sirohydrochlorin ferrochelatase family protein [Candidatus Binataceae bacterium]